ncbi:putative ribonuclease H-like domain-containing protein [Tanacetum coccineum]|uniref:Ribonuclease H-like domain-containing protein n=1 Tax=Tanacetum coccineum TaxID=301880 RepID=A0ABQ5BZZ0_9ASTR
MKSYLCRSHIMIKEKNQTCLKDIEPVSIFYPASNLWILDRKFMCAPPLCVLIMGVYRKFMWMDLEDWGRMMKIAVLRQDNTVNGLGPRHTMGGYNGVVNCLGLSLLTIALQFYSTTDFSLLIIKHIQLPKAIVNAARPKAILNIVKGNQVNAVKASACWVWKPKTKGNPQMDLQDQGVIDSGCSRHMIRNMSYLTDFKEIDGGYVAFGGNPKGGKITGRVPTGRYVVPTGRVIATDSVIVATSGYVVPAAYDIRPGRDQKVHNDSSYLSRWNKNRLLYQREIKARTILLQSLPEDHMADFHHLMCKGYDRFQKVLSQLNQMQARPDNEDCNMKFLRALPPSWSQLDSKSSVCPTHSAFIFACFALNSKRSTADSKGQPSTVNYTTTSSSTDASGNVLENVLHSFVAESDPQQQITYEDFDQIGKLDLEELDIKWQMAMLSVRINRFEKKAGRKFKFNNKDAARFDKKKVRCYQCSELGHFARECTGKKVDSKTRYSQFKIKELDKSEEPKALVSVDSMLNWSDHESEDMEKGASEVYGMIAGYGDDAVIPAVDAADGVSADDIFADGVFVATGNGSDGVSVAAGVGADGVSVTSSDATDAETQFALMGLSPQVQSCPFGCNYIYTELKKDFDNLEVQYKECFIQVQAYKSSLQNLEQQKSWYQNNQLALEEKIRILTADLGNTTNMLKYTEKLNEQAKIDNMNNKVKLEESEARFDKWMDSSKNLNKLINSSMSTRSKFGLGYGDTFRSDEVFDLSAPSIFDSCLKDALEKPLYDRFIKAVGLHAVPGPITGTFMPPSNKPDIDDTQYTYGSKSNNCVETNSVSNDFVSCDNSDKSSDSETTGFASCVSSVKSSSLKTKDQLASASSSVDLKTLHKTDDQGPCNVTQSPSFSFKENVKTPRNLCNRNGSNNISLCKNKSFGSKKCFVCGSKFHLIRDCDFYENQLRLNNAPVWKNVENIPSFVPRPAYVPAGSRNRPTSVPAGRPFPAGWHNPAARPMTRPKSHYFQQFSRPGSYNQMDMDGGRWGTAVKTSAGCSWQSNRPYMHWGSKNNGGSQQSTGFSSY